jgi:hypothetical protein
MKPKESRQDWVAQSKQDNAVLFSELDILLRSLDRFFNIENLPFSNEDIAGRNFYEELIAARDVILRALGILEVVIPENRKNAYWFRKFAESKFMPERKIDDFRKDLYLQDTPEKGLYLLYDSFINMKGIISDLARSGDISYMVFLNVGSLVSKEIRENFFFNPFKKNMNPEFDMITNQTISKIAKSLGDKDEKKHISVIYLYLFRFIRIMSFIELTTQRAVSLNTSLILLILLRSEINAFRIYIDKSIRKMKSHDLQMLLHAIAYQFSMETKRVYRQELKDILRKKASIQFRGKIENSHGILKNLTEQSVVQLTQHYDPAISGVEVFASFMNRLEQSVRLREDIHVLHAFVALFCSKAADPRERHKSFESLRNYMLYFESFTFRLLRYDDYEEFAVFFHDLNSIKKDMIAGQGFPKVLEKIKQFRIFLETTLRHIGNRSELMDRQLDIVRIETLMSQYR